MPESSSSSEETDEFLGFVAAPEHTVDTFAWKPKEFDIFYRNIHYFLPEGKTFDDLTPEEDFELRQKYRFDPLYPGIYQSITGFGATVGEFTRAYNKSVIPAFHEENEEEYWSSSSSSSTSSEGD